jgi:hypothetical protein
MSLQRMIPIPPELWEKRSQSAPPPVNKILKINDHSYNKWTQVRLQQDPYLKNVNRKRKRETIPIVETRGTNPSFTTKSKRKRIIDSVPLFKEESLAETESETDTLPVHSKYIDNVLKRKESHDSSFGVYQDDTDGSFKIGRSSFKYNDKHVFVDGKKYKATSALWELLSKSKPDNDLVTLHVSRHINKYYCSLILIEIIIVLRVRSEQIKDLNIHSLFRDCLPPSIT